MSSGKVVTPLDCDEVRWFHGETNDQETKWLPFSGRDSLKIEIVYRKIHSIELDKSIQSINDDALTHHLQFVATSSFLGITAEDDEKVYVLNGQYSVNFDRMELESLYWKDDTKQIRRGTWFLKAVEPVKGSLSEEIERHHLERFGGGKAGKASTKLTVGNYEITWKSVTDVYLVKYLDSNILNILLPNPSQPLTRGYKERADWNDYFEISHLVFVTHGIGHRKKKNLIIESTNELRNQFELTMTENYAKEKSRPLFVPIEWRSSFLSDHALDEIRVDDDGKVREIFHQYAADVMFYQSSFYRTEIVHALVSQLNHKYKLFKTSNPRFTGPVSILAHSLGSIICFDILTHYSPLSFHDNYILHSIDEFLKRENISNEERKELTSMKSDREKLMDRTVLNKLIKKDQQLDFEVKNFFAVGSPIALFINLRGEFSTNFHSKTANFERIFNIFHKKDPVAYRIEPFFDRKFKYVGSYPLNQTVGVPYELGNIYLMSKFKEIYEKKIEHKEEELESKKYTKEWNDLLLEKIDFKDIKEWEGVNLDDERVKLNLIEKLGDWTLAGRALGSKLGLAHRIDFEYDTESILERFTSHIAYWDNPIFSLFLANVIYGKPNK
ncbi:hypothetical protein CRE_09823 [Caenorhabditis remanei]|uniref:DDHD domain-containing protein n=1 Tax=Caenorhabditis remanei TaxID=31234 RepID=E3NG46_CAERE|nr:hypothetical protein CRE_09823 [Caenorhabditis remanei]